MIQEMVTLKQSRVAWLTYRTEVQHHATIAVAAKRAANVPAVQAQLFSGAAMASVTKVIIRQFMTSVAQGPCGD